MRTLCPRRSSDVQFAATTTHLEASALGLELWTAVTSPRSVLQQLPSKARGRRPNFTRAAAGAAAERAASPSNGSLRNQRPTWDPIATRGRDKTIFERSLSKFSRHRLLWLLYPRVCVVRRQEQWPNLHVTARPVRFCTTNGPFEWHRLGHGSRARWSRTDRSGHDMQIWPLFLAPHDP